MILQDPGTIPYILCRNPDKILTGDMRSQILGDHAISIFPTNGNA